MIYISHELKAIYIHIPKCGGCYTRRILKKYYHFRSSNFKNENHSDFCDYSKNHNIEKFDCVSTNKKGILRYYYDNPIFNKRLNMDTEKWNSYYKFTFVRSPYKKVVSAYLYMKKSKIYRNNDWLDETEFYENFVSFIKNKDKITNIGFFHGVITQYDHLLNNKEELNIDFIGNTDNLSCDLIKVLNKLGINEIRHFENYEKKINSSKNDIEFYEHYDETTFNIVNNLFEIDFNTFQLQKFENYQDFIYHFKNKSKPKVINDSDTLNHEFYLYKSIQCKLNNKTKEIERLLNLFFQNMEIIYKIKDDNFCYHTHKNEINKLLKSQRNLIDKIQNGKSMNSSNIDTSIV